MQRLELDNFRGVFSKSSKREKRIAEISAGINWEEAGFLKTPDTVRHEIDTVVDDQLSRLCSYFILPRPRISLLQGWNEVLPDEEKTMRYAIADSFITDLVPTGIIRLSPALIKSTVTQKIKYPQDDLKMLIEVLGHEMDHLWQWNYEFPDLKKDLETFASEGIDGWVATPSEQQAHKFEKYWVGNWKRFSS